MISVHCALVDVSIINVMQVSKDDKKWMAKHEAMRHRKTWSTSPSSSHWSPELAHRYPDFLALPSRDKDLLDMYGLEYPHPTRVVVNTSQSDASCIENCTPCITPQGEFWLSWRMRKMRGREALRFQGIYLDALQEASYSDSLLRSLAGNAFCTPVCTAVLLSLLSAFSRLYLMGRTSAQIPRLLPLKRRLLPNNSAGAGTSDDEEVDMSAFLRRCT